MSILYRFRPDECKLILIDPKMLELSIYEDIPHLLTPVVTNPNKAVFALKWVVKEMEERYKLMSSLNVKNINSYNEKSKKILTTGKKLYKNVQTGIDEETRQPILEKREIPLEKMPFIVVVIDEMADLMMVAGKEVENLVQRLAQMARASGIHLVTATQRPSVDVITGTIKANFPSRLSYKVASKFDSRTILNEMGAEQLLGSGDMLFLENGASLKRLHGGFLSESEIEKVVKSIKEQAIFDQKNDEGSIGFGFDDGEVDALYTKAVNIVIEQQKVSTSYIQRYLQIGYNRAARIVEKMEDEGLISEANNAGKRQVLRKN
jgi:S-DNA-T family DNA segregation ATPase FtsK/SpoIIIE